MLDGAAPFHAPASLAHVSVTLKIQDLSMGYFFGGSPGQQMSPPRTIHGIWEVQFAVPYFPKQHSVIDQRLQDMLYDPYVESLNK